MRLRRHSAALIAAALTIAPAVAIAGKPARGGGKSLQLKVQVKPAAAAAKGVKLGLNIDYRSTVPGKRITAPTKEITVTLPAGMAIHPRAAGSCSYTKFAAAKYDVSACPASSVVGSGTVAADARPLVATPVPGQVTLYNMKGQHDDVLFHVHTKFGNTDYLFLILTRKVSHRKPQELLDAQFSDPAGGKSLYTLQSVKITFRNSSTRKPYISSPTSCTGSWPFSVRISSYGGGPALTAKDAVKCGPPSSSVIF